MRNTATPFRDFYTWYFKDWFTSGTRSRLTVPQRSIYLDLLGFCYTEGGIVADTAVLLGRLGIGREYAADVEQVLKEFEVHADGDRRMHSRTLLEVERLAEKRARQSKGGKARGAQLTNEAQATTDDDGNEKDPLGW
jgi:uncharacterized protein YdaU (DUF1376 family)